MIRAACKVSLGAVIVLAAAAALAPSANACSCAPTSEEEMFKWADAAVVVELRRVIEEPGSPTGDVKLVYALRRVYKGPPSLERRDRLVLESQRGSSCHWRESRRPLGIYLSGRAGRWGASACSTTRPRAMRRASEGGGSRRVRGCGA